MMGCNDGQMTAHYGFVHLYVYYLFFPFYPAYSTFFIKNAYSILFNNKMLRNTIYVGNTARWHSYIIPGISDRQFTASSSPISPSCFTMTTTTIGQDTIKLSKDLKQRCAECGSISTWIQIRRIICGCGQMRILFRDKICGRGLTRILFCHECIFFLIEVVCAETCIAR